MTREHPITYDTDIDIVRSNEIKHRRVRSPNRGKIFERKKKSFYFLVDVRSNDSDSIPNLDKIAARLRGSVGNYTP